MMKKTRERKRVSLSDQKTGRSRNESIEMRAGKIKILELLIQGLGFLRRISSLF